MIIAVRVSVQSWLFSSQETGLPNTRVNKPSTARKLRWRAPRALQGLRLLFGAREGWCVHEKPSVARKARQRVGTGTATLSRAFRATQGWCGVTWPSVARKSRRRACIGRMHEGGGKWGANEPSVPRFERNMTRRVPSLAVTLYMLLEKKERQKSTAHLVRQCCALQPFPPLIWWSLTSRTD